MTEPDPKPSRRDLFGRFGNSEERENSGNGFEALEYGPLFQFSANAMGCEFQVLCNAADRQPLANCVADGFHLIEDLESELSIYRESSKLSEINRDAFVVPVSAELRLIALLDMTSELNHVTDGAFDITATPLTKIWKEHRKSRTLPAQSEVDIALLKVDGGQLFPDTKNQSIRFGLNGLTIDLGGIGKGYALDRLHDFLLMSGCQNYLIHGGQSSVIGCGERASIDGNDSGPWQIGISHPLIPAVRLATLNLNDRAIGTSGSGRQSFVVNGKRYGHIIDPRTGWPANHYLAVTVLAESAMIADALATGIFVAGPDHVQRICDHYDVSAVLISGDEGQPVDIKTINLNEDDLTMIP